MGGTYLHRMIGRIATMLAILAITLVTAVTSAHTTRMSVHSDPDHTTFLGERMQPPDPAQIACDGEQSCGATDAEMCELVCAGHPAILTSPGGEFAYSYRSVDYVLPPVAHHIGRAPGLIGHPPKIHIF